MDPIETEITYLLDHPRYEKERPYAIHLGTAALPSKYDPNDERLCSLIFDDRKVKIHDLRALGDNVSIDTNGFQTGLCDFATFDTMSEVTDDDVEAYQVQTEKFLERTLCAEKVICYDFRLRRNGPRRVVGTKVNVADPLIPDLPPPGAHNDITYDSGPDMIKTVLQASDNLQYADKKYRFRIINTWRPLVAKLEDRPLAVCDYRTLQLDDLVASDRIYAHLKTQLYYIKYNPQHRWYWFSHQTPRELLMMIMYDTKPRVGHANLCPHVSFHNSTADANAPVRESLETRSVVISLASETD
jgi:hypothetical protein